MFYRLIKNYVRLKLMAWVWRLISKHIFKSKAVPAGGVRTMDIWEYIAARIKSHLASRKPAA